MPMQLAVGGLGAVMLDALRQKENVVLYEMIILHMADIHFPFGDQHQLA